MQLRIHGRRFRSVGVRGYGCGGFERRCGFARPSDLPRRAPRRRQRAGAPRIDVDAGGAILGRQRRAHLLRFTSVGVGKGARHDGIDRNRIVSAGFQLLHELGQCGNGAAQQAHHSRGARESLIDDAVEQVLDRPSEFGDQAGADHAAAALQGVKAAPQGAQRFQIHRILIPQREAPLDRGDLFLCLLDEEFQELRIDRVRHGGSRGGGDQRMGRGLRALGALDRDRRLGIEPHGACRDVVRRVPLAARARAPPRRALSCTSRRCRACTMDRYARSAASPCSTRC